MAGSQRDKQRAARQAKSQAIREAQQRAARRRQRLISFGAGAVVVAMIAVLILAFAGGSNSKTNVATKTTTTSATVATSTTTTLAPSVAGKPCVKMVDPLPAGAPAVPVQEGPAPEKLVMQDLKPGTGAVIAPEATVTVNYIGVACTTGKIFDSSYKTGTATPVSFPLAQVIPGWTQGIPGMKVGGQRLLGIPSALAYGPDGRGSLIAPDEPLWFVVEVLDSKPAPG